jgi:hypothetical protein
LSKKQPSIKNLRFLQSPKEIEERTKTKLCFVLQSPKEIVAYSISLGDGRSAEERKVF